MLTSSSSEKIFKRGDALADIESKAHDLTESTPVFAKAAEKLKKKKWRQNKKVTVMLGAFILCICCCLCCALVYLVLAIACGGIALTGCIESSLQSGGGGGSSGGIG